MPDLLKFLKNGSHKQIPHGPQPPWDLMIFIVMILAIGSFLFVFLTKLLEIMP